MIRGERKRWCAAPVAAAAIVVFMSAGAARADVTVERTMKTAGFAGFGAGESTSVEKLSGLRKRDVSQMKMTGFLGKMAGDIGGDEITDIQKDAVWKLDHKKKTYTESRITPPPQSKEPGERQERRGKEEKPKVRVVRNEITVSEPGDHKTIGAYDCTHYVVTWVVETEDLETKARSESTMVSDLWTTPETSEIRALQKEETEFTKAWLKKIGWDMTDQEAQKMGLAMVGSMIGGDEESFRKGAKEVAEKMSKIKGYPIGTGVKWMLKSSGGEAAAKRGGGEGGGEAGGESGGMDLSKGLGGLMSAFGKKVAKGSGGSGGSSGGSSGGEQSGTKTVFDTYTEIRKISTGSLSDGEFAPPSGYKKVE
ncbi:MAG TPA: hypothetical protein VI078_10665 [bacterium]